MSQINIANGNSKVNASQNTIIDNKELGSYQQAIKVVVEELKKDKEPGSIYYGWQSNLACIIMDCNDSVTHVEANNAAKRFLKRLIG